MKVHNLQLATEPFEMVASGKKTIESRLYDEKRQKIELGDTLIFTNRDDPKQTIKATVVDLLRYKSFEDLFSSHDASKFGGPNKGWLLAQIHQFYTENEERIHGVVGIEFEIA